MQRYTIEDYFKDPKIVEAAQSMSDDVLGVLIGGLWHTTSTDRYNSIIRDGYILPEPNISEAERWATKMGKDLYPFVRTLGGVSLFDFKDFDPNEYSERCPNSSWYEFVPFREIWQSAVWIEINRDTVKDNFISGNEHIERWKAEEAYRHRIMPFIEAAHIGKIPVSSFRRVLLVNSDRIEELG